MYFLMWVLYWKAEEDVTVVDSKKSHKALKKIIIKIQEDSQLPS